MAAASTIFEISGNNAVEKNLRYLIYIHALLVKKKKEKKYQWVQLLRVLIKAVCKNIFSTIEDHVLKLSFLYKIEA